MPHSYDELEWNIYRLGHACDQGKLVFLLGAGINTEYGLPRWSEMLIRLTTNSGRLHTSQDPLTHEESKSFIDSVIIDPLLQAASLRGAYASPADWVRALRQVLAFENNVLDDETKPLGRIAKVVGHQYRKNPEKHIAVLTFNYDNLLKKAIEREMGDDADVVASVSTGHELARVRHRPGIFVYQLHGSLENEKSEIVLDAYSYVRILAAPANHWSWSCMNTFLFQKDAGVMLIGLSLVDPSLRLLLTHAAEIGMPLSAVFIGDPLDAPVLESMPKALTAAWMKYDVQHLFDDLLEELSLIPYHVTDWSEIGELIDRIVNR
jgi:hypothetical protein